MSILYKSLLIPIVSLIIRLLFRIPYVALISALHPYLKYRSTNIAMSWLVMFSRKRSGKGMSLKLANEILEASKGLGNSIKRKEETHKMAEANKAFAHFR